MAATATATAATVRGSMRSAVMIGNDKVHISANLQAAILETARTAYKHVELGDRTHACELSVRLRYMVLSCGPTESAKRPTESLGAAERPTESIHVNHAQLPHAFARMVVQVPSEGAVYGDGDVSVSASLNGSAKSLKQDGSHSDDAFRYMFAYTQSTVHIHAPSRGCGVFLVFDIVSLAQIHVDISAENHAAEDILAKCVPYWEQDAQCERLAVVMSDPSPVLGTGDTDKKFTFDDIVNVRDRGLIRTLLSCRMLDVGLAGEGVYVYMCVCECA
jgi:hypothetical protein